MNLAGIMGLPQDVVEIHAPAPPQAEIDRRAMMWAEETTRIYHEARERFGSWQVEERYMWIGEQICLAAERFEAESSGENK